MPDNNAKIVCVEFLSRQEKVQARKVFGMVSRGSCDGNPPALPDNNAIMFRFIEDNCGANVFMNRIAFQHFTEDRLIVTAGAYGLCKGGTGGVWYEWGHPNQLSAPEMLHCPFTGGQNCHVWLEDSQGKVFDVLPLCIPNFVAKMHGKTIDTTKFAGDVLILGLSKQELEEAGLKYVPAAKEEQKKAMRSIMEQTTWKRVEHK